jgi:mRNA interferase MazF
MEKLVKGEIVVIPFPFSDLSSSKKRPALIIANPIQKDILLAQITSKINLNKYSIEINNKDLIEGSLPTTSYVKLNRLFSADINLIKYKLGKVNKNKLNEIEDKLIQLIKEK